MVWDPVPFAVEGGANHSGDVLRQLAYGAFRGNEGIIGALDLRVLAQSTPTGSVRVSPGACSILNRASSKPYQTYAGRNPSEDGPITIAATGSSAARSDLIIARVENPWLAGESWTPPSVPADGPYIRTRVISGVPNTTKTLAAAGRPNDSAIVLARIDIPANTSAITQAMIKDLREVANPRRHRSQFFLNAAGASALSSTSWVQWPAGASWSVDVPAWAVKAKVRLDLGNVVVPAGGNYSGSTRVALGSGSTWAYLNVSSFNFDGAATATRPNAIAAGEITIPASMRGTTQTIRSEAVKAASGSGNINWDGGSVAIIDVEFYEVAADV